MGKIAARGQSICGGQDCSVQLGLDGMEWFGGHRSLQRPMLAESPLPDILALPSPCLALQ